MDGDTRTVDGIEFIQAFSKLSFLSALELSRFRPFHEANNIDRFEFEEVLSVLINLVFCQVVILVPSVLNIEDVRMERLTTLISMVGALTNLLATFSCSFCALISA